MQKEMTTLDKKREYQEKFEDIKRQIEKGNLTNNDVDWLQTRVYNHRWMALEMLDMFDSLKKNESLTVGARMKLLEIYGGLYQKLHGSKLEIDVNANIHVNQHRELITKDIITIEAEAINNEKK